MPALGFGQRVTGGGENPERIRRVTKAGAIGEGTLPYVIDKANEFSTEENGYPPQEILIRLADGATRIEPNLIPLVVTARNLTIRAVRGAVIDRNCLKFDCSQADNILLRNLRFASDGVSEPSDTILIDAVTGRNPIGFWIDHCEFQAYEDLNITCNAADIAGAPPVLITISNCRFFDRAPSGEEHAEHGAITISGARKITGPNVRTNAYATVCRNLFQSVRRRSPRSSGLTLVHAFNNVLLDWGSDNPDDRQQNGMEVGKAGILVAQANYFSANVLKQSIELTDDAPPPRLTVPRNGGFSMKKNRYLNGAEVAHTMGRRVQITRRYLTALGNDAVIPSAAKITDDLRDAIMAGAGPQE